MHPVPQGYVLRALTTDDLAAVQALLDECESADTGEPCVHEMEIAVEVRSHWFDLERGAWVMVGPDGRLAGAGWAHRPEPDGTVTSDHYVRPDSRDHWVDEVFFDLIEERAAGHARERREDGDVRLLSFCEPRLKSRRELLAARGYERCATLPDAPRLHGARAGGTVSRGHISADGEARRRRPCSARGLGGGVQGALPV